jgi:hypothetical protein
MRLIGWPTLLEWEGAASANVVSMAAAAVQQNDSSSAAAVILGR